MLPREGDLPGLQAERSQCANATAMPTAGSRQTCQAQVGRMREESQSLRSTVDRLTREMEAPVYPTELEKLRHTTRPQQGLATLFLQELKRINDDLAAKVDDDTWLTDIDVSEEKFRNA